MLALVAALLAATSETQAQVALYATARVAAEQATSTPLPALDGASSEEPVERAGSVRLRLGGAFDANDELRLIAEADASTDDALADDDVPSAAEPPDRERRAGLSPRALYLQWAMPAGLLRAGLQTSHFGLGLLANDGATEKPLFGLQRSGDRGLRLMLINRPLSYARGGGGEGGEALVVAIGADAVWRDDNAAWLDGDRAVQGIASILWQERTRALGVYGALRTQEDADGDTLDAIAVDGFGRWRLRVCEVAGAPLAVEVAAEAALLTGRTDRLTSLSAPEGVDVAALGALARVGVSLGPASLRLDGGYASGDANPDDGRATRFAFDPDYKVGLVLFDTALRRAGDATVAAASDPGRVAQPSHGLEALHTRGRIAGVRYLNPTLVARLGPYVKAAGGLVFAWTSADNADPYETFRAGGAARTVRGQAPEGQSLGTEVDVGLVAEVMVWRIGVQAGWLFPASAAEVGGTRLLASLEMGIP